MRVLCGVELGKTNHEDTGQEGMQGGVLAVPILTPSHPQAHRTTTGRAYSVLLQLRDSCTLGRLKNSL